MIIQSYRENQGVISYGKSHRSMQAFVIKLYEGLFIIKSGVPITINRFFATSRVLV